jgi:hypothetical protein
MSVKNKGWGQEGSLVKLLDRQRVQKAAVDAAKKLEDATKEAGETARALAAQADPEEVQVRLSGWTVVTV